MDNFHLTFFKVIILFQKMLAQSNVSQQDKICLLSWITEMFLLLATLGVYIL